MKLYLTSTGFESDSVAEYFRKNVLLKDQKNISFLVITVQDSESDAFYLQKTLNELKKVGVENIDIFELKNERFDVTKKYDVIYVCGGNTFVYLDRIRKTGLDEFIIDSVKRGSVYVGVSAGSIVVSHSIEIAGWGNSGDINDINLKDLKGLGLTDVMVFPHYSIEEEEMLEKNERQNKSQIIRLTDGQALFIDNGIVNIIN